MPNYNPHNAITSYKHHYFNLNILHIQSILLYFLQTSSNDIAGSLRIKEQLLCMFKKAQVKHTWMHLSWVKFNNINHY